MGFLYETHLHTSPVSRCGVSKPADYIEVYKKAGYSGYCITNHFFNGNSGVDHSLPWKDQIDFFYSAYEEAFAAAQGTGIDVFFGIEYNFEGDEYLLYGISKQWLFDHPQMMRWSHQELFDEINRIGGLMLQAHPFRNREYMRVFAQHPECVHGFEVYNSCNRDDENPKALALAKEHKLLMTGGSDIHNAADCERFIADGSFPLSGVELEHKVHTVEEFISEIKSGTAKVINRN